jgi:uncharacterized protein (TIGR03437 family)
MADAVYAIAFNQDGTPNTSANPAQPGSTVKVFATGLGPLTPALPDGAIVLPPLPVDVAPFSMYFQQFQT